MDSDKSAGSGSPGFFPVEIQTSLLCVKQGSGLVTIWGKKWPFWPAMATPAIFHLTDKKSPFGMLD